MKLIKNAEFGGGVPFFGPPPFFVIKFFFVPANRP